MVDISTKEVTARQATAEAIVQIEEDTREALFGGKLPKGDALATVRLAAIMGTKRTPELVPLCHPLPISGVEVKIRQVASGAQIVVTAKTRSRTGIEMEAMTGAMVGALALYDMIKGVDRGAVIGPVRLLSKHGGKSGSWEREL